MHTGKAANINRHGVMQMSVSHYDGITVESKIIDMKTGLERPFEPADRLRLMQSILGQMTEEELAAMPKAEPGVKAKYKVLLRDGLPNEVVVLPD